MPNKVSPTAASTWVAISIVSQPPVSPGLLQILQNSREDSNGSVWHFKNLSQLHAEWPALYKGYRSRIRIRIRISFRDVPIQDWDLRSIAVFPHSLFLRSMIETARTDPLVISAPDVWRSLLSYPQTTCAGVEVVTRCLCTSPWWPSCRLHNSSENMACVGRFG